MHRIIRHLSFFFVLPVLPACLGLPVELMSGDAKLEQARIIGVVTDGRYPLPGAAVQLDCDASYTARSDTDGRFVFDELPQPAVCTLSVTLDGYRDAQVDIEIPPTIYRLRIVLEPLASGSAGAASGDVSTGDAPASDGGDTDEQLLLVRTFSGRVTDLDGVALGGADIELQLENANGTWNPAASVTSDADGRWVLSQVVARPDVASRFVIRHRQRLDLMPTLAFSDLADDLSLVLNNHAPSVDCVGDADYGSFVTVTVAAGSGASWLFSPVDQDLDPLAVAAAATTGTTAVDVTNGRVDYQAPSTAGRDLVVLTVDDGSRSAQCRFDVVITDAESTVGRR